MQSQREWATVGKIVGPFGLRGEVKVRSLSDVPERFGQLAAAYVTPDYRRYAIKSVRPYKGDMLLLKLSGINDANAAETLRDCDLCIPLDELAELPADSYYQHDILGLQVMTLAGRELGPIEDIIVTGSNDVYVVKTPEGRQLLIPALKEIIKQIDLVRRVMYIDPIRGLIDDDALIDQEDQAGGETE